MLYTSSPGFPHLLPPAGQRMPGLILRRPIPTSCSTEAHMLSSMLPRFLQIAFHHRLQLHLHRINTAANAQTSAPLTKTPLIDPAQSAQTTVISLLQTIPCKAYYKTDLPRDIILRLSPEGLSVNSPCRLPTQEENTPARTRVCILRTNDVLPRTSTYIIRNFRHTSPAGVTTWSIACPFTDLPATQIA